MSCGFGCRPARSTAGSADGNREKMTNVTKLTTTRSTITQRRRRTMKRNMSSMKRPAAARGGGGTVFCYLSELAVRSQDELNSFFTPFTFFDVKLTWLSHSHGT